MTKKGMRRGLLLLFTLCLTIWYSNSYSETTTVLRTIWFATFLTRTLFWSWPFSCHLTEAHFFSWRLFHLLFCSHVLQALLVFCSYITAALLQLLVVLRSSDHSANYNFLHSWRLRRLTWFHLVFCIGLFKFISEVYYYETYIYIFNVIDIIVQL